MPVLAVIPARYASSRFPGKPLARKTGKYLIQHVVEQVRRASTIDRVLIATDDERILRAVREFGGECVMTAAEHPCGTDRIAEVARSAAGADFDLIVNVQGDEPEIEPEYLDRLVMRMREGECHAASTAGTAVAHSVSRIAGTAAAHAGCSMATLACLFPADADPHDPHLVKVVLNQRREALYFSRAAIPFSRDEAGGAQTGRFLLHLGVYAYRREFLLEFASWIPTPLEQLEKLEQLRALEYGAAIAVEIVPRAGAGIDTPEEYDRFVARQEGAR